MARPFTPKVVTANALLEGDVIYMTDNGHWVRTLGEAQLYTEKDAAEAALELAQADPFVVGPYLADAVKGEDGRPQPTHFREDFRRKGPSNYAHGKQFEGEANV